MERGCPVCCLQNMRSERGLHDHFAGDLTFEQVELGVLGEALRAVHSLALDFEDLVPDDQRARVVAPLDDLGVAFDLNAAIIVRRETNSPSGALWWDSSRVASRVFPARSPRD